MRLDNALSTGCIFWFKDESLEASGNLPDPDVIAQETDKMRNGDFPILGTGLHAELKSEE